MLRLNESFSGLLFSFPCLGGSEVNRKMQKSIKISIGAIVTVMVIVALALSQPLAFAGPPSGRFNPQTQFPVGTTITFKSLNGVAVQKVSFTKPRYTQYDAAATITVKVEKLTEDGGIRWKVLSGTFTINGQTYTVTDGDGHMNAHDEIASGMDGQVTGPDGASYHWRLNGFATLYNGAVLVGLRGGIGTLQSNHALLGYHLGFMATMTST